MNATTTRRLLTLLSHWSSARLCAAPCPSGACAETAEPHSCWPARISTVPATIATRIRTRPRTSVARPRGVILIGLRRAYRCLRHIPAARRVIPSNRFTTLSEVLHARGQDLSEGLRQDVPGADRHAARGIQGSGDRRGQGKARARRHVRAALLQRPDRRARSLLRPPPPR